MNASGNCIRVIKPENSDAIALTLLVGGGIGEMIYLGGTVPTGARPYDKDHTFLFFPKREGLVGVAINYPHGKGMVMRKFLVPVVQTANGFTFDLERIYIPPAGVLVRSLTESYGFEVCVDGEWFTTNKSCDKEHYYVEDSNDLFSLMFDKAAVEAVKAVAVRLKSEETELERARAVIEELSPLIELIPEMREREEDYHRTYLEAAEEFVHSGYLWHLAARLKGLETCEAVIMSYAQTFAEFGLLARIDATLPHAYAAAVEASIPNIRALIMLARDFRAAFEQGRWGLYGRLSDSYFSYKTRKGPIHFTPKE